MHQFARPHDGVDRAGADAGGAADTGRFVNPCQCVMLDFGRSDTRFAEQSGNVRHNGLPSRRAQVNGCAAFGESLGVGQTAVVAAFPALGLRQQAVEALNGGGHGGWRSKSKIIF